MRDNFLLAFASAQFELNPNGNQSVPFIATIPAIQFGQNLYIYAINIVNGCIFLIVLFEALRTRGWRRLEIFDYKDVKSVIVAASIGGSSVSEAVFERDHRGAKYRDGMRSVGQIKVMLREKNRHVAIVSDDLADEMM